MSKHSHQTRQLLLLLFARDSEHISTSVLNEALSRLVADPDSEIAEWLVAQERISPQIADRLMVLVEQRLARGADDATALFEGLSSLGQATKEIDNYLGEARLAAPISREEVSPQSDVTQVWDSLHALLNQRGQPNSTGTRSTEDRFRIIKQHAAGGLGVVFVAEDTQLRREVALKHIQHKFGDSQALRDKFVFEAEVTGQLEHPCIVPVYALGTNSEGRPYYAMRFIRGDDLRKHIQSFHEGRERHNFSSDGKELRQLLRRFLDVCNAISYAHERGVLHRDLKPGNIMLGKFGETFVVDWGLAKAKRSTSDNEVLQDDTAERQLEIRTSPGDSATQYGSFLGTAAYAPPEQLRGQLDLLDCRSDVYSLGAILFEILTGQPPFKTAGSLPALLKQLEETGAPLVRSLCPLTSKSLASIADKALQAKMEDRYPTVQALKADVEAWLDDLPVSCMQEGISDKTVRWVRKHRGVTATAVVSLFAITIVAMAGVATYYSIAKKEKRASELAAKEAGRATLASDLAKKEAARASQEAIRANRANEINVQQLKDASRSELSVANSLIESSYSESDEKERRSRPGSKSNWHLGVGHLLNAIKLDPTNDIAKRRLYSTMVHQGRRRRDFPTDVFTYDPRLKPVTSPSGAIIAYLVDEKTVRVMDAESENNDYRQIICTNPVKEIALLSDDATLLTNDGTTNHLWDIASSEAKSSIAIANSKFVMTVDESVVVLQQNGKLRRFNLKGKELPPLPLVDPIHYIPVSLPESAEIVTFKSESGVRWTNVSTGETHDDQLTYRGRRLQSAIPYTQEFVYSLAQGVFLQQIDDTPTTGAQLVRQRTGNQTSCLAVSPDGGQIAIGWVDGVIDLIKITDKKSGQFSAIEIASPRLLITQLRFSSDGLRLSSVSDKEVRIWNAETASPLTGVLKHENEVNDSFFNHSGTKLFTVTTTDIYCWPTAGGGKTQVELSHEGNHYSPLFSHDSNFLTTNAYTMKNALEIQPATHRSWDISSLSPRDQTPFRSNHVVHQMSWDPDSKLGITCSRSNTDSNWQIWNSQGELLGQHKVRMPLHHREKANWVSDAPGLIALESMSSKTHNGYELWDWKSDKVIWNSSQAYGDETICGTDGDRIAIVFRKAEKEFLTVLKLSDRRVMFGPYALQGKGDLEAIQMLHNESAAICWRLIDRKLTSSSPIQKYELQRLDFGPELQTSPPLEIQYSRWNPHWAIDLFTFYHKRLGKTFIYNEESNALLDATSFRLIQLESATEKLFNVRGSADGELLLGTNSMGGQLRVWSVEDGKLLGESEHNGAADSPIDRRLVSQLTDSQNIVLLLDSELKNQLEEPLESMPRNTTFDADAMSPLGDLIAARTKNGVCIREIPSDAMVAEIVKAQPNDLEWIEAWIGLQSKADGGFRVMPAQEQLRQIQTEKPNEPIWLELNSWLQSNSPRRPMTPRSRWLSKHVNTVAASAGGERAKQVCLLEDPSLPDLRLSVANALDSPEKPAQSDDVRLLAAHLRSWGRRGDLRAISNLVSASLAKSPQRTAGDSVTDTKKSLLKLTDALKRVLENDKHISLQNLNLLHRDIEQIAYGSQLDRSLLDRSAVENFLDVLRLFQQRLGTGGAEQSQPARELRISIGELVIHFALLDFCNLIRDQKWELASKEIERLADSGVDAASVELAREILISHRDYVEPSRVPSEIEMEISEQSLSRCKPSSAVAGWGGPKYDSVPAPSVVLKSMHRPYARGIYAHAASNYVYQLDKKWSRLQADVGIQAYATPGSVTFEVVGDGQRLWSSGMVTFKQRLNVDIDVSGVSELKLIVTDGGNGGNSDWAIWLDPRLKR